MRTTEAIKQEKKMGILGGTFNPVHNGHLAIAREALNKFGLTGVIFIPAALPPRKTARGLAAPSHRLEMLRLALDGRPECEISDLELKRGGRSYTIDTVRELRESAGGNRRMYLIIGADNLLDISGWKGIEELVKLCRFIVVTRPGFNLEELDGENRTRAALVLEKDGSNLLELSLPVSSSEIRKVARRGEDLKRWVPAGVAAYIRKNRLYRSERG